MMIINFKNNVFIKYIFQNYFCGSSWEQKFQTHKKDVEHRKKLLKKLGNVSNQKDVANYNLSCSLQEELVAVSERKDISTAMGKLSLCLYSTVGFCFVFVFLNLTSSSEICTVVIKATSIPFMLLIDSLCYHYI